MALDPALEARLRAAGVDVTAIGDPADAWRQLHVHEGRTATLLDRYELEAAARGIAVGAAAEAYGRLKVRLAEDFRDDRLAYNEGKSAFIDRALADAGDWAARVRWRP